MLFSVGSLIVQVKMKVAQLCLTLCHPMGYTVPEFSRPEYWSGLPFPSPGDLPNPVIKPRFPALKADSLPSELSGKPRSLIDWVNLRQNLSVPVVGQLYQFSIHEQFCVPCRRKLWLWTMLYMYWV